MSKPPRHFTTVYAIAVLERGVCHGHGDFRDELKVAPISGALIAYGTRGEQFPPVFATEAAAQDYIASSPALAGCRSVRLLMVSEK